MTQDFLRRVSVRLRLNRLWKPDLDAWGSRWRQGVHRLEHRIEQLEERNRLLDARLADADAVARGAACEATQVRLVSVLDRRQRALLDRLPALLDEARLGAHIRRAVEAAPLLTDPYDHVVVERLLPDDVYALLVEAIPPAAFFSQEDPIKQNLLFPMEFGPALTTRVWEYMDEVIIKRLLRTVVLEKFEEPLERHLVSMFGPQLADRAAHALPQSASGGRLMLRRPGYHLDPHRDPKRAMLTCLMYLARKGDSEEYGTRIFRVHDDEEATYKGTYYPEQLGHRCELVKTVPFRPNTMLVFLNARGAHGATIPRDAPPDVERYSYQFYVTHDNADRAAIVKALPDSQRAKWRGKPEVMA